MHRKCGTDTGGTEVVSDNAFLGKFSVLYEKNNELYIFRRGKIFTILYIHTLQLTLGKAYNECEKYNFFVLLKQ